MAFTAKLAVSRPTWRWLIEQSAGVRATYVGKRFQVGGTYLTGPMGYAGTGDSPYRRIFGERLDPEAGRSLSTLWNGLLWAAVGVAALLFLVCCYLIVWALRASSRQSRASVVAYSSG